MSTGTLDNSAVLCSELCDYNSDDMKRITEELSLYYNSSDISAYFKALVDSAPERYRMALTGNLRVNSITSKVVPVADAYAVVNAVVDRLESRGIVRREWTWLRQVSPVQIEAYLRDEYPQIVAFVLSRTTVEIAAKVFELLPENYGMEVLMRISRRVGIKLHAMRIIEDQMRRDISGMSGMVSKDNNISLLRGIVDNIPDARRKKVLTAIQERSRELYADITGGSNG